MERLRRVPAVVYAVPVTLVAVALVLALGGAEMFSPGPLSTKTRPGILIGGVASHAAIGSCAACHAEPWSGDTMATRCLVCHTDVRDQFDGHHPLHGSMPESERCRRCHSEHNGSHAALTSLDRFSHDFAAFKLTGEHLTTACQSCHADGTFRGTPQTCVACHAEPKAHAGRYGTRCAECHSTSTWHDATFNHDLASFKLTGTHRNLACSDCHKNNVYAGTPQSCVACHAEPTKHRGKFGTSCAECHTTSTWLGATFKHTFPINHGRRGGNTCATCHKEPGTYMTYTCYGCHEHNPARIEKRHLNIVRTAKVEVQNCVHCHANGRENGRKGGRERTRERDTSLRLPANECPFAPPAWITTARDVVQPLRLTAH